jgi:hypothetical protein
VNQSVEFNPCCFRRRKPGDLDDAETSNPSPERIDEAFVENHRLKRALRILRNKLRFLSNRKVNCGNSEW